MSIDFYKPLLAIAWLTILWIIFTVIDYTCIDTQVSIGTVYQKEFQAERETEEWDFYNEEYIDVFTPDIFILHVSFMDTVSSTKVNKKQYNGISVNDSVPVTYKISRITDSLFSVRASID